MRATIVANFFHAIATDVHSARKGHAPNDVPNRRQLEEDHRRQQLEEDHRRQQLEEDHRRQQLEEDHRRQQLEEDRRRQLEDFQHPLLYRRRDQNQRRLRRREEGNRH